MCTRGLAVPARRSTLVTRGAARSVAATHTSIPAQETPARRPVPIVLIARRRRRPRARTAQELPPSRYGSPAARWPALRQGLTATRLDVANQHRKETKREKRVEWPVGLLTVGWRWSRGRLGGEVYEGGVGVHAGGRPPRLLLLVPSWFTSSSLRRGAAPCSGSAPPVPDVPQQRRAGGDTLQDLLLLRLHFSRSPPFCPLGGAHTGLGKTPMRVGEMRLRPRGSL
jgi:hypothetical protein